MMIEIKNLRKSFQNIKAVDDLSFCVKEGELFAFLGVNGAGKSTTINILGGILQKDEGYVKVCGEDIEKCPEKVKGQLGMVFQNSVLDRNLSVYDNLKSRAALYGIFGGAFKTRLGKLDELLGLNDILSRPVCKLSGGQKRRADIARALLHEPKLLILDEPTTGLDPQTRRTVWKVIGDLRKTQNLTVFLTTHYMEEAAEADFVVILDRGRKAAEGTPHDLKNAYAADTVRMYSHITEAEKLFSEKGIPMRRGRGFLDLEIKGTAAATELIAATPWLFDDYEVVKGDMDSVFLRVTGKEIGEN